MGNGSFPQKLKELRKKHKYTQHMLEILTGIDRTTISAYEKGTREPSFKNLIILADLCGRTNRDILDITNEDALTKKKLIAVLNNINKGD